MTTVSVPSAQLENYQRNILNECELSSRQWFKLIVSLSFLHNLTLTKSRRSTIYRRGLTLRKSSRTDDRTRVHYSAQLTHCATNISIQLYTDKLLAVVFTIKILKILQQLSTTVIIVQVSNPIESVIQLWNTSHSHSTLLVIPFE